jgi:hypothetical protein
VFWAWLEYSTWDAVGYWVEIREYGTAKVDILTLATDDSLFFG